jgi:uncharacterized membrane protein YGL010W
MQQMPQQPIRMMRHRRKRRFRWAIIIIPLVIIIIAYVLSRAEIGFSFNDVTSLLKVRNTERYCNLAVLAIVVTAIVAIVKVVRSRKNSQNEGE